MRDFGVKELDDIWSLNVLKQKFLQKQLLLAKHSRRTTNMKRKKKNNAAAYIWFKYNWIV